MPFIKIWIHLVWATKDRQPFMKKEIRQLIFNHIKENAVKKNIYLDHIHCLISMNADQNIATIMQLLKGESSFWVNQQKLTAQKFGWQDEYFAVSIGHSQINSVRKYIRNQNAHHKKTSFKQEYDEFIKKYGFDIVQYDKP